MTDDPRAPRRFSSLRDLLDRLRLPWQPQRPGEVAQRPDGTVRDPEELAADRLRVQVGVVRKALGDEVAVATEGSEPVEDDADAHFLYHPRRALVREEDVEDFLAFFAERGDRFDGSPEQVDIREVARRSRRADRALPEADPLPRLALFELPARADKRDRVLKTIEDLEDALRAGVATPDHVLYVTTKGIMCPATEPEEPRSTEPWPAPGAPVGTDRAARVAVVDTGLWTAAVGSKANPWMTDVHADASDVEQVDAAAIHEYAGHGTFVSGVVKCLAPDARVEVEGVLTQGGAVFESAICQQLHEALLDDDRPEVVSISAGTYTRRGMAMLAFTILADAHELGARDDVLIVAAAGNDSTTEEFWPAAFDWVIGVGSVDPDGKLSDFSNHGDWVKVYARGRDLVNAFPDGTYTCHQPENIHNGVPDVRQFRGMARWSGTSFSTPVVSGLIAARMSATGEDARTAAAAIIKSATVMNGLPVVGPLT